MAEEGEKGEGKGFKVADRRRFSETGEAREAAPAAEARPEAEEPRTAGKKRGEAQNESSDDLPGLNFSTFVISLSSQALMLLG
jgi:hypothetical protein